MGRISIAGLLGFVAVFAIGLAALVNATSVWTGVAFTLTMGVLLASVLALILPGGRRGGWLGFALFGWSYLLMGNISALGLASNCWLVPDAATEWVFSKSNPQPVPPPNFLTTFGPPGGMAPAGSAPMTPEGYAYIAAKNDHDNRSSNARNIGRWLWVLLFAEFGAILVAIIARVRRAGESAPVPADGSDAERRPAAAPDIS